jgi:hypothetical protein
MYQIVETERLDFLAGDIRDRFKGRRIGLRGVLTSLDGDLAVSRRGGSITVCDINKLLEDGVEQVGASEINIACVANASDMGELPDRVEQYLLSSVRHTLVQESENRDLRDRLVPAVIVYDMSQGSIMDKYNPVVSGYGCKLPNNSEDRSKVILAVYPIDLRFAFPN